MGFAPLPFLKLPIVSLIKNYFELVYTVQASQECLQKIFERFINRNKSYEWWNLVGMYLHMDNLYTNEHSLS